ncbi:MAG: sigma-54-dependent Fis family transcriptional regulator [Acidobacteria bacterium]|nr:sigma-54-dependent Fis family transcriptional regulator [Acidobacteriota bacterium]
MPIFHQNSLPPEPTLVGNSTRLRNVQRMVDKLAQGKWPALVLGETGTGKEVVARSIHAANPVGPFVTIDCSSFVGPLMESELFGHAKGSFTGAFAAKMGLLEAANGGTAFFDEIGELPLDLQAKLLRVLQEKEFRPVGSIQTKRSDFRIVAATNRDLAKEVEKGTFRRDLYYRLNVVTVRLAPLRDRKEDIPLLIQHFLNKFGSNHSFTAEAMEALLAYEWPGNVRELENMMQQMVAMRTGPLLHVYDLPSPIQNSMIARRGPGLALAATANVFVPASYTAPMADVESGTDARFSDAPILPLVEMERRAILNALSFTKGDRLMAAGLLGIGRTTLYRKLKEYQVAV